VDRVTVALAVLSVVVLAAVAAGVVVAAWWSRQVRTAARRRQEDLDRAVQTLLAAAGERFDAHARAGVSDLDRRKELIDAELERVRTTVTDLTGLVQRLERDRADQLGRVSEQLQGVTRVHGELHRTTAALREALTSSQARGQWGERMAEDVLRAAGFKPGVNYVTQRTLPDGSRPDVTFLLPGDLELHMDVKFPLANHLALLEADSDAERDAAQRAFLRDVRARVKELAGRSYVDPASGTLDCVLMFIPNDRIYAYVHEADAALLDDALAQRVVPCSPSTLFAVLAVIRRSIDAVALERTSDEIVALLSGFADQWVRYVEELERLGKQLETVRRTYDGLAGTRRRQLERQLDRVEELRDERGVSAVVVGDGRPRLVPPGHDADGPSGGAPSPGAPTTGTEASAG
jgi:DNA recombination protein RmuC